MDQEQIFELYEKLYFHEAEVREKLLNRLQIPLGALLAVLSVFAYFVKGISFNNWNVWNYIFIFSLLLSIGIFLTSSYFFKRAFTGHTYEYIPSALETERYKVDLIEKYKEYENGEELASKYFKEYLYNYYASCSSANAKINDERSFFIHRCNTFLILIVLPVAVTYLVFNFAGLDKNQHPKALSVLITEPIMLHGIQWPLEINGKITSGALKIDLTEELKGYLDDRKTEKSTTTSATTSEAID